jgi:hypothetical protein
VPPMGGKCYCRNILLTCYDDQTVTDVYYCATVCGTLCVKCGTLAIVLNHFSSDSELPYVKADQSFDIAAATSILTWQVTISSKVGAMRV